jgi:hypothetical protein
MGHALNNADDISPKNENGILCKGKLCDSLILRGNYQEVLDYGIFGSCGKAMNFFKR